MPLTHHDGFAGTRPAITSRSHALVEAFRRAARGEDPDTLLLDGAHLVAVALEAGWPLRTIAATWSAPPGAESWAIARACAAAGAEVVPVSRRVMEALSPVRTPGDIVALADRQPADLAATLAGPAPLVLVACDVQDPGNLGAVVRAADACGAHGVVCLGACADPFGWKALRGSMGSALRLPVIVERHTDSALARLRAHGLAVVAAAAGSGVAPRALDWTRATALLVGNEGAGLPGPLLLSADARVAVPMRHGVESLNVAVAAGILLYEASRQRGVP